MRRPRLRPVVSRGMTGSAGVLASKVEQSLQELDSIIDEVRRGNLNLSAVEPSEPDANQVFLDRSVDPPVLKVYNEATESWDSIAFS